MAVILPNSIYVRIPKTGSTWVAQLLVDMLGGESVDNAHLTPAELLYHSENYAPDIGKFSGRKFFTVVRHPVTWYRSIWAFRYAMPPKGDPAFEWGRGLIGMLDGCADTSLEGFLDNVFRYQPGYLTRLYRAYLGPEHCAIPAVKLETVRTDLPKLVGELEGDDDLDALQEEAIHKPPENGSACWEVQVPDWYAMRICELESDILDEFGYDEAGR